VRSLATSGGSTTCLYDLKKIKKICQSKQNLIIIIINQSIKRRRRRSTCTQKCHLNTSRSTGSDPFFVCLEKLLHRFHDLYIYIYIYIYIYKKKKSK
jgi:hypothetical protein